MVEDPRRAGREIAEGVTGDTRRRRRSSEIVCWSPLDREDVEVVREAADRGSEYVAADAVPAGVARAMQRAVNRVRLLADVLHDVDLAALRPFDHLRPASRRPARFPGRGEFDARLEAAERAAKSPFVLSLADVKPDDVDST